MDKRKILVADASPLFCSALTDILGDAYDVRTCHDGSEALALLAAFEPEVLVTDLAIPKVDGLSVLKELRSQGYQTRVLLTTCFLSSYIAEALKTFCVDMVTMKPCDLTTLAERIRDLATEDGEVVCPVSASVSTSQVLRSLNISANRRGFQYLEQSIELCVNKPTISLTKELYPRVGEYFGTSGTAVERAMREVITVAWNDRNESNWRAYFTPCRNGTVPRPTNSQFICQIAEHMRHQSLQKAVGADCEF